MKKNLLWLLILSSSMIFISGCGSTSNKGPGAYTASKSDQVETIVPLTSAQMQKNHIVTEISGTNFSLSLPFTKKTNADYTIELNDFSLDVKGCYINNIVYSPAKLLLDGAYGSSKTLQINGSFTQKCNVRGYTLYAKQTLVDVKKQNTKSAKVSVSYDYTTPANGLEFVNVPFLLDIREYKRYKIDFQLMHNGSPVAMTIPTSMNEGTPSTPNTEIFIEDLNESIAVQYVAIQPFPNQYGSVSSHYGGTITLPSKISSQATLTDADGVGRFLYNPPSVFPPAGTTYDLELAVYGVYKGEPVVLMSQKVQLRFELKAGASSGEATTLSIVFGYRPPKDGQTPPDTSSDNPGTGDFHETAEWDQEGSKLINYYAVHAVTSDGQRPIVGTPIKMSLVNGVKKLGGAKLKTDSGAIANANPVQFSDTSVNFLSSDIEGQDKLIIIPSEGRTDPSYLGGWTIGEVFDHSLNLIGSYSNIKNKSGLSYLIGNERRLLGRNIVTADVQAIDLESITDEYGMAYFKVTYDPELVGHTITLEAHTDSDVRVGVAKIVKPVANNSIMQYISKSRGVENSGSDEFLAVKLYLKIDSTMYRTIPPDSDTLALYPIVDLDIDPSSFSMDANSSAHCNIDEKKSSFHVLDDGTVNLVIQTDGNTSDTGGVDRCGITWNGDEEALGYDYEY